MADKRTLFDLTVMDAQGQNQKVSVTIDMDDVRNMALKATYNLNRRCTSGPITVAVHKDKWKPLMRERFRRQADGTVGS